MRIQTRPTIEAGRVSGALIGRFNLSISQWELSDKIHRFRFVGDGRAREWRTVCGTSRWLEGREILALYPDDQVSRWDLCERCF